MKRFLSAVFLAVLSLPALATTLNPIQLLNPAGSTSGQVIASTGPTTAPAWTTVTLSGLGGMPITGGTFTGPVMGPTPATTDASTKLATTSMVNSAFSSPPVSIGGGVPTSGAFTSLSAPSGLNNTPIGLASPQPATVTNLTASGTVSGAGFTGLLSPYALLASPTFTGIPLAPNAAAATNTTQIATTAFVQGVLQAPPGGIGTVTPSAGAFTTLKAGTSLTLASLVASATAPTIASGFGTSPSITSNNGTAAFAVQIGTGGTAFSGTIGLPTAAHGWVCDAQDVSGVSATVFLTKQISIATTAAGFANYNTSGAQAAWGAGDTLIIKCSAF